MFDSPASPPPSGHRELSFDAALGLCDTTEQELLAALTRRELLLPDDIVFLSGSLIEGLGNRLSDIDVFVVTDRQLPGRMGQRADGFELNGLMIDVQMVARAEVDALLDRLDSLPATARHVSRRFSFADWLFLHRLATGRAAIGEAAFAAIRQRTSREALARFKFEWATEWITRLQMDLAGLHAEHDWKSMLFAAQQILGYAVDCLLAAHRLTTPAPKWRMRLLDRLPPDWEESVPGRQTGLSAADRYLTLHQTPAVLDAQSVYTYALRAVTLARILVPWSACRLEDGPSSAVTGRRVSAPADDVSDGPPLPFLGLAVQIRYHGGHFVLAKLDNPRLQMLISPEAFRVLSFYDGETTRPTVDEVIHICGGPVTTFEDVRALVRNFQLSAMPSRAAGLVTMPNYEV